MVLKSIDIIQSMKNTREGNLFWVIVCIIYCPTHIIIIIIIKTHFLFATLDNI